MSLPVVIALSALGGFVARTGEPLPFEVHADSREEALRQLRELVNERRANGVEIIDLDQIDEHPWKRFAGYLKDDPL